jgi:hypothetical protein
MSGRQKAKVNPYRPSPKGMERYYRKFPGVSIKLEKQSRIKKADKK